MKVANNMDSVFADCTKDELDFDVMFDEDDCLIDLVAGFNEAGEPETGYNPEETYEFQLKEEAEDPLTDKCDCGRREGSVKDAGEAPEGSEKNQDKDFETPEGMAKEVPGSGNSEESKAHDVTKEIEDSISEGVDLVTEETFEMLDESDDVKKLRKSIARKTTKAVKDELAKDDINVKLGGFFIGGENAKFLKGNGNTWLMLINPKNYIMTAKNKLPKAATANKVNNELLKDAVKDVIKSIDKNKEQIKKAIEAAVGEDAKVSGIRVEEGRLGIINISVKFANLPTAVKEAAEDPITDKDDAERREGKVKDASSNVEGEKQEVIDAAQEGCSKEACAKEEAPADAKEEKCENCGNPLSQCKCSVSEGIIAKILKNREKKLNEANVESQTDDTFEKKIGAEGGEKDAGPLQDKDDAAQREGKEKEASNNVEGEKQEVIDAAQEAAEDIDSQLSDPETVPDKVQTDGSANNIPTDAETQSSDGIEPATEATEEKDPVVYDWRNVTESDKMKIPESEDDKDIEMVQNGEFESDSELKLDVDYDDDELIDIAMNGGSV